MKKIKQLSAILVFLSLFSHTTADVQNNTYLHTISYGPNSWVMNDVNNSSRMMTSNGVARWSNPEYMIRTFFYIEHLGSIHVALNAKVHSDSSSLKIDYAQLSKTLTLKNSDFDIVPIGDVQIDSPGYYFIDVQGIKKQAEFYADIQELIVRAPGDSSRAKYLKDDFYFGRRGPSTHLIYQVPDGVENVEWFYSEIEIDTGQDVIGSYFMANGFREGYFGIQVNSATERRILFSIWSPYKTDDPNDIPDDYKIRLLKKGNGVHTGEFGNEGAGGQSYKIFDWKTNMRYAFLVGAQPTENNSTIYTAYFYDPDAGSWNLIAGFERPHTKTYLMGLYSFLENFIPDTGVLPRRGGYYNQWVRDTNGTWHEITHATFSADATARKDARLDYSGGVKNGGFYLKNCGFTNDRISIGTSLSRESQKPEPDVKFDMLE